MSDNETEPARLVSAPAPETGYAPPGQPNRRRQSFRGVREICGREDARGWVCVLDPHHHTGHDYRDLLQTPILHPDSTPAERVAFVAMQSASHASQTAAIAKNVTVRAAADLRHTLAAARVAMWSGAAAAVAGVGLIAWPLVRTIFDL